ncbi:Ubiquinone/menaquinone biosynthesis C-methyltransferase UbiE [Porphyridium purpureum]|uniref:Ubiquinone/menaquinone biosynthesis C-methyltransferase UbiE n=1 Tax=Porphyridium purpureum TaxID=35688 RepID=A0A5J4Z2F5_PORPP|nr:Ubiquinone/menaquinone biosynthesis C-methyltransferase UbiE [Porphyridium purpureum]|eukprot:POR0937..scf295_1
MATARLAGALVLCVVFMISTVPEAKAEGEPDGSGQMFDTIAASYDMLNKIISLGRDEAWRLDAIAELHMNEFLADVDPAVETVRVLDVATGTADVAIAVAASTPPHVVIDGIDPSINMLDLGREKVAAAGLRDRVTLQVAQSEMLPFEDETFDFVTVSFGVRNFRDRLKGLGEIARVLKRHSRARLVILELSEPTDGWLAPLARFFIHDIMPFVAGIISNHPKEYRYLQQSLEAFPQPHKFGEILNDAGLVMVSHRRLAPFGAGPDLFVVRKLVPMQTENAKEAQESAGIRDEL